MKLTITITMDNAAFEPSNGEEIARILEKLAVLWRGESLEAGESAHLLDFNGNKVGKAEVTE